MATRLPHPRAIATAAFAVAFSLSALGADLKRSISEDDLMKFVWIADPQVAPDGRQAAFTRVIVNEKNDDYDTSLWIVPMDGTRDARRLTAGTRDTSPRWSPDGRRLAFVRSSGGVPQIFVLDLVKGGEAQAVTDLPRGGTAPLWSPDGTRIAFGSTTKPEDLEKKDAPAQRSDVRVINEAEYRNNSGGWAELDRPVHLWVTDVAADAKTAKPRQLTSGKYGEAVQDWSSDGSRVYFTSTRIDEPYFQKSKAELFAVPSGGGDFVKIASVDGAIGSVRRSPDGRTLAFVAALNGTPERSFDQADLFVTSADGSGAPRNLTSQYDFDINGTIGGDQAAPRGGRSAGPFWAADGSIVIASGEQGDANLIRVNPASGAVTPISRSRQTVLSYSLSADGRTLAAVVSTQTTLGDLYALDASATSTPPKRVADPNTGLFSTLKLSDPEEVSWESFDGRRIQGWLLHPPDFDRTKKYPLILEIHGGPHSAYGDVFAHEFQLLAARGYVVLFANPRGSSNYGQEFGNLIQFRYPGDDYKDLMAGVDAIVKRPYVDPTKLGVTGGSGGGLLTNWTVTQTTRFAAAVAQRDIADWYGFWFTADFAQFTPSWFHKAPWEDPQDFAARSPITHVANVKTPMMFVLGDDDLRTPPADGGEMMFRALKYLKVPTVMVRFPGETHELSRSGKPRHRVERLQHIVGWFDTWLMGKKGLYKY
jgi:dipeptidyl aminopeptidase/acylaminoacyl peptidase